MAVSEEDRNRLASALGSNGFEVGDWIAGGRLATVTGSVLDLQRLVDTKLQRWTMGPDSDFRVREGVLSLPSSLAELVVGIHGLDDRPQVGRSDPQVQGEPIPPMPPLERWHSLPELPTPDLSTRMNKGGVAILVFGSSFLCSDLRNTMLTFQMPVPHVHSVFVLGETNRGRAISSFEATLDVCMVASLLPGAPITLVFAPRTSQGLIHALSAAMDHDSEPSVISISYGFPETGFTQQAMDAVNRILHVAAQRRITVCCSTGNNGSLTVRRDGRAHVEFPASSPWVLSCGGCIVSEDHSKISAVTLDKNGTRTGGGLSRAHLLPKWQNGAAESWEALNSYPMPTRGIPDACAHAEGFPFLLGTEWMSAIGTSLVPPIWASLIARCNHLLGKNIGYLNPLIYQKNFEGVFTDIVVGSNGHFTAGVGWDPCTGLGMPNGNTLLAALRDNGPKAGL